MAVLPVASRPVVPTGESSAVVWRAPGVAPGVVELLPARRQLGIFTMATYDEFGGRVQP